MANSCPFLELPVELRLLIYGYAVLNTRAITIGTAKLEGTHADITHRLYGGKRAPFPGIPVHHEPIIDAKYTAALLSPTKSAYIDLTPTTIDPPEGSDCHLQTTYQILSQLCRQARHELKSHFSHSSRRQNSLFVQYPHGLHVLQSRASQLVRQSRSVHLAGTYIPTTFNPARAACFMTRPTPRHEKLHGTHKPDSHSQLGDLIKSMFGPSPSQPVEKLEMRIYYPGDDSYSTVWGDDDSPTAIALRNVHRGEIHIEIWRGRYGTGVYLTVRPTASDQRLVSTVWRRLQEGQRGEPKIGSWVVDPKWPEWTAEHKMLGEGDTIISVP